MSGLVARIEEVAGNATWVTMVRYEEDGIVIGSLTANDDGRAIAGTYTLTFSSVVAGVSATVTVAAANDNPYNGLVVAGVLIDGATVYDEIIGGIDIVFDTATEATDSVVVRIGHDFGQLNAFAPDAGVAAGARRIQVENSGADVATGCEARLLNRVKRFKKTGEVFLRVRPFAEGSTEKLTAGQVMPYVLAVANVAGSGAAKTMDVLVDTALITTVRNLTTLGTSNSEDLNVVDYYRVESGLLTDLEFKLSEAAVNSDTENLLVFSNRFIQIATDTAGVAGTYGVTDVVLTEVGETAGEIQAAGLAYFWMRTLCPDGGNSASNPYPLDVCLSGTDSGAAGWTS